MRISRRWASTAGPSPSGCEVGPSSTACWTPSRTRLPPMTWSGRPSGDHPWSRPARARPLSPAWAAWSSRRSTASRLRLLSPRGDAQGGHATGRSSREVEQRRKAGVAPPRGVPASSFSRTAGGREQPAMRPRVRASTASRSRGSSSVSLRWKRGQLGPAHVARPGRAVRRGCGAHTPCRRIVEVAVDLLGHDAPAPARPRRPGLAAVGRPRRRGPRCRAR